MIGYLTAKYEQNRWIDRCHDISNLCGPYWQSLLTSKQFFRTCVVSWSAAKWSKVIESTDKFCAQGSVLINKLRENYFPSMPHIVWILMQVYSVPILYTNITTKVLCIKIFKLSISHIRMTLIRRFDRNFTTDICQTMITGANVWDTWTNYPIRAISEN